MPEYTYIPKGKIAPYVRFIWYSDGYAPLRQRERVLPNGACQLIINLGHAKFCHYEGAEQEIKHEYDPVVLVGIHTGYIFLDSYSRVSTMGVVLRPGGVSALFGIPAVKLRNQAISVQDICKTNTTGLRQKLTEEPTPEQKFKILITFLNDRLNPAFRPVAAVNHAVRQLHDRNGTQPIAKIIEQTGYSRRWFSAMFKETVGITPKQYSRICRFQYTLRMIRNYDVPDWANLALTCGYYDQAHFNHDFKKFAGISPSQYHRHQSDKINHLPV